VDADQAAEALSEVGDVRRLTRRSTRAYAFPFLFYGAAAVLAGALGVVAPGAVGWWWAATALFGGVLTWRHYRARAVSTGVSAGWRRYAVAWGLAGVGMALVFSLGPTALYPSLPWGVIGLTYLGLGLSGDGPQMTVVGLALCLVASAPLMGVPVGLEADPVAGGLLLVAGVTSFVLSRGWLSRGWRPGWVHR